MGNIQTGISSDKSEINSIDGKTVGMDGTNGSTEAMTQYIHTIRSWEMRQGLSMIKLVKIMQWTNRQTLL